MVSRGIHIGYNILHMPLVRFYLDCSDGFGKLRDIYFAYRCQKAKIMPSFDKTGPAQIAPDWGAQIAPIFFRGHNIDLLFVDHRDIQTSQGCSKRLLSVEYAEAAHLASSFALLCQFPQIWDFL